MMVAWDYNPCGTKKAPPERGFEAGGSAVLGSSSIFCLWIQFFTVAPQKERVDWTGQNIEEKDEKAEQSGK